ncbi:hypothetical protein [Streptomyces niveus]|uniref:hypothetical protein n=1 Tax=Streptomyces niveus TaxID=193462 RepID=UPI0003C59F57|nr:hypothetical protein M877_32830 [Streptomyces niveus NCIMB 11891]
MYRRARKVAASLTVAVLIVVGLAVTAVVRDESPPPAARSSAADVAGVNGVTADDGDARDTRHRGDERDRDDGRDRDRRRDREREPFGASCRTTAQGSLVTAFCHNPYPETDRVQLHIECARWWDVDSDSAPAEAGPAGYARLSGRCWKEVESAWVSHERVAP